MSGIDYQSLIRAAADGRWTTLDTLQVYVLTVLVLLGLAVLGGALGGLITRWLSETEQQRTTVEERSERLLKLISSTERHDRSN